MTRGFIFIVFVVFGVISVQNAVASLELVPHRALYKMSLIEASPKSGIIGARGAMAYRFEDSCDSWISETKVILKINYSEGNEVETTWAFTSWESKDGLKYNFYVRHSRNGDVIEVLEGKAWRDTKDGAATAEYSIPEETTIKLPKGTLFPTRHLTELLKAGQAKQLTLSKVVFDGASLDNPYHINAMITKVSTKKTKTKSAQHVRMAFFPVKAKSEQPEFELGITYRPDGVAEHIKQEFGAFSLDLAPNNIEILKKSDC